MQLLRSTFLVFAAAVLPALGATRALGQSCTSPCPTASSAPTDSPNGGGGTGSNDPAFIMPNSAASLAQRRGAATALGGAALKPPGELVAAEQARYQGFLEDVKAHPIQSYGYALGVWKENATADLQRLVLMQALERTRSSEESAALQFMLKALGDAPAQRQECLRLGRGNSLEKALGARRLMLLEENPKLQTAMMGQ